MFVTPEDIPRIRDDIDGPTMVPVLLYVIERLLSGEQLEDEEASILRDLATYASIKNYVVSDE